MTENNLGPSEEPRPFLPHAEAQHQTEYQRAEQFSLFMKKQKADGCSPEALADWFGKYLENEQALRLFKIDEQYKADEGWKQECQWHLEQHILPRNREPNYWTFYTVERLEFSPAEGGCFYDHYTFIACFPQSRFTDKDEAKEYARDTWGHIFKGDMIGERKARPISSAVPEVDAEVFNETLPLENQTLVVPHYE